MSFAGNCDVFCRCDFSFHQQTAASAVQVSTAALHSSQTLLISSPIFCLTDRGFCAHLAVPGFAVSLLGTLRTSCRAWEQTSLWRMLCCPLPRCCLGLSDLRAPCRAWFCILLCSGAGQPLESFLLHTLLHSSLHREFSARILPHS